MAISAHDRNAVAQRARYCCEYCQSQLKFSADSYSVEHIVARSRDGSNDLSNLALSCQRCNNAKFVAIEATDPLTGRPTPLFHPRQDDWAEHFA
jgi:5-methylcytosine-specific restriction endonuclease McrA